MGERSSPWSLQRGIFCGAFLGWYQSDIGQIGSWKVIVPSKVFS